MIDVAPQTLGDLDHLFELFRSLEQWPERRHMKRLRFPLAIVNPRLMGTESVAMHFDEFAAPMEYEQLEILRHVSVFIMQKLFHHYQRRDLCVILFATAMADWVLQPAVQLRSDVRNVGIPPGRNKMFLLDALFIFRTTSSGRVEKLMSSTRPAAQ